jgi:hypothetical protein
MRKNKKTYELIIKLYVTHVSALSIVDLYVYHQMQLIGPVQLSKNVVYSLRHTCTNNLRRLHEMIGEDGPLVTSAPEDVCNGHT